MDSVIAACLTGVVMGGVALFAVQGEIADTRLPSDPVPKVQVISTANNQYADYILDISRQCGYALDEVAESMTDEARDEVPLEVWQSAYSRCLINNNATI